MASWKSDWLTLPTEQGSDQLFQTVPSSLPLRLQKCGRTLQCPAIYESDPNSAPRTHDELKMLEIIDTLEDFRATVRVRRENGETSYANAPTHLRKKKASPSPPLEVRESTIHGRGVYATVPIRKGKRIIEYKGKRVRWELASEQADGPHTFLFGLTNGKDVIDPDFGGNDARWINHSCEPNCEAIEEGNRVFIYALRSILPGEELFYDYGLEVDQRRTKKLEQEYECRCGARQCRGTMLAPGEKVARKRTA